MNNLDTRGRRQGRQPLNNYSHNHLSPYISLYHLVSPVHFMPSSKLSSHPPCVRPFSSKAGRKSMVSLIPAAMPRLGSRRSKILWVAFLDFLGFSWIFLASWHPVEEHLRQIQIGEHQEVSSAKTLHDFVLCGPSTLNIFKHYQLKTRLLLYGWLAFWSCKAHCKASVAHKQLICGDDQCDLI